MENILLYVLKQLSECNAMQNLKPPHIKYTSKYQANHVQRLCISHSHSHFSLSLSLALRLSKHTHTRARAHTHTHTHTLTHIVTAGQREIFPMTGAMLIDDCCEMPKAEVKAAPAALLPAKPEDPCEPGGSLCGPVRPKVDYGADIVLTKGWMGEKENPECCPCLGKGSRRINYGDYPGAGFYNPYTMEMCTPCGGCEKA